MTVLDSKLQSDALLVEILRVLAKRINEIANEIEEKPGHMKPHEVDLDVKILKGN